MTRELKLVYVVDDDESVRRSLDRLLKSAGFAVRTYDSASAFLADRAVHSGVCLVLDIKMPEMSGLELVEHMVDTGTDLPTILITAVEEELSQYQQPPVLACLQKPFLKKDLLNLIEDGLSRQSRSK